MYASLKKLRLTLLFLLVLLPCASSFSAASLDRLSNFFDQETTYFAEFYQVILDEGLHLIEESAGLMWMQRTNRFRWEYFHPFAQTIVSDGKNVWVYDAELEQTTVRFFSDVVDRSAAEILAGNADLDSDYLVEDMGIQGELAWVSIKPKEEGSAQFQTMRLGFDQYSLKVIEILENLGNTTRLQLFDVVLNSEFDQKTFEFVLPDGVDLIDAREE